MAVDYLEVKSALPDTPALAAMLYHLHQQQRLGWRIALLPLLENYWQQSPFQLLADKCRREHRAYTALSGNMPETAMWRWSWPV